MTIRDQVSEALTTINQNHKSLRAVEATEWAMVLASLLSRIMEEEANAEGVCNMYLVTLMEDGTTAAKANAKLKATNEWIEWQHIKATRVGVVETIRVLKRRVEAVVHEEESHTFNPS